ncbi:MAG: cardiolipin synthetase [Rhodobacteraceae bacterium]|jgi:cardiolipin synthase|nr:cardiolipin synthetase [Paracoccaceae bacterium]
MIFFVEHLLVVLGVMAVALAMVLALQQPRSPQSSAAWILFIILMPYLAVPVFIALGFRKQGHRFPPIGFTAPPHPEPSSAAAVFAHLGAPCACSGNRIELHATPEAARVALNDLLVSAQSRVDILLYIVENDDSGRAFVQLLTALQRRGVAVRLSLDWLGTLKRPRSDLAEFVAAGGELRFFSPFLHLRDRGQLNLRNHRKLVMVDRRRVWAGGRNVGDDYLASPPGKWNDLSYVVEGPVMQSFADVFQSDWAVAGGSAGDLAARVEPAGTAVLQAVPAGPDEPLDVLHDGLVAAIHRADRRVWIATPYFIPSEVLSQALTTAARRGVDVRLFVPTKSNQWTADLARGAYLRAAEKAGCRISRFLPGMMHAKAGLIDGMGLVGSANFDVRSMLLNFELMLACHDPETVAALEGWFAGLSRDCAEGLLPASIPRRLAESVFRLGAPIL